MTHRIFRSICAVALAVFIGTMVLVVKINTNRFRTKLTFRKSVIRLRNPVLCFIFPFFTVTYP